MVDLEESNQYIKSRRQRYLSKICTDYEYSIISKYFPVDQDVSIIWSVKESAYKVYSKMIGDRFVNAKRINIVDIIDDGSILLHHRLFIDDDKIYYSDNSKLIHLKINNISIYSLVMITERFVYSISVNDISYINIFETYIIKNRVNVSDKIEGIAINNQIDNELNLYVYFQKKKFGNVKYPVLVCNSPRLSNAFSITHDGGLNLCCLPRPEFITC